MYEGLEKDTSIELYLDRIIYTVPRLEILLEDGVKLL